MPRIQQLSQQVINKIAAGEVIERPSSVVKELLENSIDAGATRIEISILKGGTESIKVADNGCGIEKDQIILAATSHATSKISDSEELFSVSTMGFRGEALASIGSVSHMRISSRVAENDAGVELEINGGEFSEVQPCGMPVGSTIEVRDLFFNTPVRRKYLRTTQTEMSHVVEAFTRIALANPEVHLSLRHNERLVHDLPSTSVWQERIGHFFGTEIEQSLIPIHSSDGSISISGFVADPTQNRGNNKLQYLFLNRRHIRDRSLQHALGEAFRGLLLTGRYPICFLQLKVPTEWVDVNVHPAKLEVRFQDGSRIYSQLLSSIRERFLTTDLTAKARLALHHSDQALNQERQTNKSTEVNSTELLELNGQNNDSAQTSIDFNNSVPRDWTKHAVHSAPIDPIQVNASERLQQVDSGFQQSQPLTKSPNDQNTSRSWDPVGEKFEQDYATSKPAYSNTVRVDTSRPSVAANHTAIQVHRRYLVTESEDGMVIIDQHALHERILYEQIREKVLAGALETQSLLVPEPVNLSPSDTTLVLENKDELAKLGIGVDHFGGKSVVVTSYPAMLSNINPSELLRSVLELFNDQGRKPEKRDILDELLHMISCKAAIKAGDALAPEEIEDLLIHRDLCQDAHHCPHGRPTALVFSRNELDRRFKRI